MKTRVSNTQYDDNNDGFTIVLRARGRSLVWDLIHLSRHTGLSHLNTAVAGPVKLRTRRRRKRSQSTAACLRCTTSHPLQLTLGAVGESALDFLQELGRRIASSTAEPRSFSFLMQRLSVAVQRGNAVCVGLTGTAPSTSSLDNDVHLL